MYNVFTGCAPSYICNMMASSRSHSTRLNSDFIIPHVKTQGLKGFRYNGIKLWNALPNNIMDESKDKFKDKLKVHLFQKMKAEEDSDFVYY